MLFHHKVWVWHTISATKIIRLIFFSKTVTFRTIHFKITALFFLFKWWGERIQVLPAMWYNCPYRNNLMATLCNISVKWNIRHPSWPALLPNLMLEDYFLHKAWKPMHISMALGATFHDSVCVCVCLCVHVHTHAHTDGKLIAIGTRTCFQQSVHQMSRMPDSCRWPFF